MRGNVDMSRKHYELIAECLRDTRPNRGVARVAWDAIVARFVAELHATNVAFNATAFINACNKE